MSDKCVIGIIIAISMGNPIRFEGETVDVRTHANKLNGKINGTSMESLSIVIPFYNEESAIPQLYDRLSNVIDQLRNRWNIQLILVDDGSSDNTFHALMEYFERIKNIEVLVIQHTQNNGIGAAMFTGFKVATGDLVCTMESDCTYSPEKLPEMIDTLIQTNADIVTGSPYHPDGLVENVKYWRIFLSRSASRIYSMLVSKPLYCYTCFYRVYRKEWAKAEKIIFSSRGFLGVTEILIYASFRKANIVEFPLVMKKRQFGESKMKVAKVVYGHLWLIGKILWVKLRFIVNQKNLYKYFGFGSRYFFLRKKSVIEEGLPSITHKMN